MKKGVFISVSLTGIFLVATLIVACGGNGGGGTPKSSSAYAGSNMPSVIDSTSLGNFADMLGDVGNLMDWLGDPPVDWDATGSSSETESGEYSIDGSGGGTYSETYKSTYTTTTTQDGDVYTEENVTDSLWKGSFDSFVDSGNDWPYTLEGDGSFYVTQRNSYVFTYSEVVLMAPAGQQSGSNYVNYSGLTIRPEWASDVTFGVDGHIDQKYNEDLVADLCNSTLDADISYSETGSGFAAYYGLLNTKATMAYDGSTGDSTVTGSGTLCREGDEGGIPLNFYGGCVDFVIDALWEETNICDEGPSSSPDSGTLEISTMDANAKYDYGATSTPGCFKYLVDADNNGAYEYSAMVCD